MVLKNRAQVLTVMRQPPTAHPGDVDAVDQDLPSRGLIQAEQQLEKRAFAGTGVAGEKGHGAFREFRRHVHQGFLAIVEALGDPVELDLCHAPRLSFCRRQPGVDTSSGSSAATNSAGSNGRRSSAPSPTPI